MDESDQLEPVESGALATDDAWKSGAKVKDQVAFGIVLSYEADIVDPIDVVALVGGQKVD